MTDLILKNVRPMGGPATDLAIAGGRFAAVAPPGTAEIDGEGALLIPGLVEAHTHLDKTLLGRPWYRNEVGPSLLDRIETERAVRATPGLDLQVQSERQAILSMAKGTTHIRSHVDIDTEHGLRAVEAVLETREKLAGMIDIELVAFPQSGLLIRPGTVELLDQALSMGVEIVGGLDPCGIDRDPKGHLDAIFGLAEKHGKPLDIHLHETGSMGAFSLEEIIARTRAHGMQGKVAVSHAFCLGGPDRAQVAALQEQIAETDIRILTTAPAWAPVPAMAELRALGIKVGAGTDGVRDTWGPFGNADMLERAMMVALKNNFRRDDEVEAALDICTHGGAAVMAVEDYGLDPDCRADCVLVEGETMAEAVSLRAPRKLVLKAGQVIARDGVCVRQAP